MYQQLIIVGNIGSIQDMRYTPGGDAVIQISVAVNKSWTNNDGIKGEKTTWFRVSFWRRGAETIAQYARKGAKIFIIGEVGEPSAWIDNDGKARAGNEVTAMSYRLLDSRQADEAPADLQAQWAKSQGADMGSGKHSTKPQMENDDDIPF